MFCEMAAYAKSHGRTLDQLLDEAFAGFGYFEEKNASIYFEGAEGANKIARLLASYAKIRRRKLRDQKSRALPISRNRPSRTWRAT